MFLEGRIIEFLDSDQLHVAYVRKQERDRLLVVDPRGRNLSVGGDRVAVVHRAASEDDFPALARQISDKVSERQSEIDIELLWQSVGAGQCEHEPSELAQLFFGEDTPEAVSAIFRALSQDMLFFKRKGAKFLPRTEEQVGTERARRKRQNEHEEFRRRVTAFINDFSGKKTPAITPELEPVIARLHQWLRSKNGDEVGTLMEEIAGPAKARDAAYDILVRAGRIDPAEDRFLVIAGVESRFSPQLIEAAERLTPYVHVPSRTDDRNLPAFTIDDDDTLEVDDALTIQQSDSETIVGIHIADVSAFVSKGDLLDAEAGRRSSTIYLPSSTVRMFPERLSTDLASLKAEASRPAFTVEVRFDADANPLGYRIGLSTIRVARRFSYDDADAEFAGGNESLRMLHNIANKLQRTRTERGAITFRRRELKIQVHGEEITIRKIDRNSPSREIVSEMMILANGLAADFASLHSLPIIFRVQEPREALAVETAPLTEALAFERLRKTFKRSRLSLSPGPHSGLGLTAYTQASSPIRRYADLVTQRQFTAMLMEKPVPYAREELLRILSICEAAEQEIRAIEDRSTQFWLLRFLQQNKTDELLPGVVLDGKGTVELEDFYLRGKVAAAARTEPGTRIMVKIESIAPVKGDIQFNLASHA